MECCDDPDRVRSGLALGGAWSSQAASHRHLDTSWMRRLQSFMLEQAATVGSVETSDAAKRAMAAESLAWNCDTSSNRATFRKLFPELVALRDERVRAAATAPPPAPAAGAPAASASSSAPAAAPPAAAGAAGGAPGAAAVPAATPAAAAPPAGWVAIAAAVLVVLVALYLAGQFS